MPVAEFRGQWRTLITGAFIVTTQQPTNRVQGWDEMMGKKACGETGSLKLDEANSQHKYIVD